MDPTFHIHIAFLAPRISRRGSSATASGIPRPVSGSRFQVSSFGFRILIRDWLVSRKGAKHVLSQVEGAAKVGDGTKVDYLQEITEMN
jgi:hypothetical protein